MIELDEKEGIIASLTRERDDGLAQIESLRLELVALENKAINDARSWGETNADLMRELADERSAAEMQIASAKEKIAYLEGGLTAKVDAASAAEEALGEALAALDAVKVQYVGEAASAKKLEDELRTVAAKLVDAEASTMKSASEDQEASAKQIRLLESQTSSLTMQLKEANDKARKSEEEWKDYEAKVGSMQEKLTESSSALRLELEEKEGTITTLAKERDDGLKLVESLRLELAALKSKADDARLLEESNASLMRELADQRSAMESQLATTERKISSLEEELKANRDAASTAEKSLEETRAALDAVRVQYVGEAASAKKLEDELSTLTVKLADAEASKLKSASEDQEASAKQIRLLESQTSSLTMQLKEANDKARKSEGKLKDYEAKVESMQGTLMQSSTNVLARANELAAAKEEAQLAMAEQAKKNERLRSELDRVTKEMSDSLAEANVEITQRGAVLERKERILAELQDKYDSVLDQMEKANASAKSKIELQAEQLRTAEASGSEEKSALVAQISQLSKEISSIKSDAQKTVTALNSEINNLAQEIKQEQRLRDEAMKNKSGLEQSLMLAVKNAEKSTRDMSLEVEQMSLHIEQSNAAAAGEAEKSRRLMLDLKEMRESLNKADVLIKQRDDVLRTKESALFELQRKNEQLLGDIKNVQVSSQKDVSSKSAEINVLKDMVANLTANVDKEIKLRQDVVSGKMSVESLLQKKLDDATKAMEKVRADARRAIDVQTLELRKLESSASKDKNALASEISQLKEDTSIFQANAQKAIDARTKEIRNLDQVIVNLKSTIAEEKRLKEVAMQGKSELEKALQTKIDQLSEGIAIAQKNATTAVQGKNMELDRLDARIKELEQAANAETALKIQATKERDDIGYQLKAKIAQLGKDLADDRATSQSALKQRDTLLSSMQVDLNSLSNAKDEVQKERDAVEKELTTKIFRLKNKLSTIQMTADQTIRSKSDEVDSLKLRILHESKSKDSLIQEKSDELARMAKDLHAEYDLVAQLLKNVDAARAEAAEAIKEKKKALDEKASVESKMRADLEELRNDEKISRAINEIAVSKLVSELEIQQSAMDAQQRANQEAEDTSRAAAESEALLSKQIAEDEAKRNLAAEASTAKQQSNTRQTKQKEILETSKPKGFGKPAMKKPPTETSLPPKTIPSTDGITAKEAEQVGEVRVTEPEDVIVDRIDAVAEVARKLQHTKDVPAKSIPPTSTLPDVAGDRKNALRQLVTPQGRGIDFVKRNNPDGPSSQISNKGRSSGKNPLADLLLVAKGEQSQAPFPKRKAPPAPSSQLQPPRQGSPSTPKRTVSSPSSQGDTRKHGSSPFPKREAPPAPSSQGTSGTQGAPSFPKRQEAASRPSSQASIPRQGAPAPQVNSPANTILGNSVSNSPLTSLVLDASVAAAFPERMNVPAPSSQETPKPLAKMKRLSLSDLIRARPNSSTDLTVSAQPNDKIESIAMKKRSLKDLIPSMGKPIGSFGNKKTTTRLGGMASPEQKPDPNDNSGIDSLVSFSSAHTISKSVKKRSLKDLIPSKGTLGSYGNKMTTTKLGGMASPQQASSTVKVEKQKAMKEDVIASVTANVGVPTEEASKSDSKIPSYSSLSALIQSQNPRQISPLQGRYKERMTQTKLGMMVKTAAKEIESPSKQLPVEIATEDLSSIDDDLINVVAVSMKVQEAFQRALLSTRIANDAKAKVLKSLPQYRNAGLSQVVPSQTKPTLSQQKAFANSNRRTSLFPEKMESHLSRLLQK